MPLPAAAIVSLGAELLKLLPFAAAPKKAEAVDAVAAQLVAIARTVAPAAVNEQQAVEQVRAMPQLREQFVAKAAAQWADIQPMLEFDARQTAEARSYLQTMTSTGPEWRQIGAGLVVGVLSMTIIVGGGVMFWRMLESPALDPGQKGMVLGALLAAFTAAVSFWFGSSATSRAKDQTIQDQARR